MPKTGYRHAPNPNGLPARSTSLTKVVTFFGSSQATSFPNAHPANKDLIHGGGKIIQTLEIAIFG
jgi:hypothetical protein